MPFDPGALLGLLTSSYPIVGAASLVKALREHPEYFGGGRIIGKAGDVIEVPGVGSFDVIFSAGTSAQRWQMLYLNDIVRGPIDEGPYPLEAGPLEVVDVGTFPPFIPDDRFSALVADSLRNVDGAIDLMNVAAPVGALGSSQGVTDAELGAALASVAQTVAAARGALAELRPSDLVQATEAGFYVIDASSVEWNEPDPGFLPTDIFGLPSNPVDIPEYPGQPPGSSGGGESGTASGADA